MPRSNLIKKACWWLRPCSIANLCLTGSKTIALHFSTQNFQFGGWMMRSAVCGLYISIDLNRFQSVK